MPMRIDLGVAKNCGHAIFKTLGNEVLQTLRLIVDLVPGVFEDVVQKQLKSR